jgi:hypothetical protein
MAQPKAWRKFQENVVQEVETFQNTHKKIQRDTASEAGVTADGKVNKHKKADKGN